MELVLEQKQIQKLSAQMIQSVEILQMSTPELHEYVEEQLLENPLLEREEAYDREEGDRLLRKLEWLTSGGRGGAAAHGGEAYDALEQMAAPAGESLYDHLSAQIPWERLSPALSRAVECVLTGLNDKGWLEETREELACRGGAALRDVLRAEELIQGLEPAGVGARSLADCLALQLERMGEDGLPLTIARHHLEDVARSHFHQIGKATGADREAVQRACALIRSLEPCPGAAFACPERAVYIVPDIVVTEEDGRLQVRAVGDELPRLMISAGYLELLRGSEEEQVRDYLVQKLQQAQRVMKSIERRRSTMLRCAQCIVERQEEFFRRGRRFLRPMTLADAAADVGMHLSTISRAVRNKYIQCAWGVFPMSVCFSRAVGGGTDISPVRVKTLLRDQIEREDKGRPLSDQKLCDTLAKQGVFLARRTVAKYRGELGYPAAPGRKEFGSC